MGDIYENFEEYNLNKKCQILVEFDDMFTDAKNLRHQSQNVLSEVGN